jgi:ribosomal protein L11 methyltransferase
MSDHVKIEFEYLSNEQKEIVVALLSEMDYEGFEEEGDLLKAYISSVLYDEERLRKFSNDHGFPFSISRVKTTNWNKEWESNFHPVIINDSTHDRPLAGIRADFHEPLRNVGHEIIITPKMSFGTGHHATTLMMMKMMAELDFKGKQVLDFGTGTGILAIFAEKLGASKIIAIDCDDQSIENATENFQSNNSQGISLLKASSARVEQKFDIILANIIKVVILGNFSSFAEQLNFPGIVLLSGLLREDESEILHMANENHLYLEKKMEVDSWMCLQMRYQPAMK